jgi:hypothetical protein
VFADGSTSGSGTLEGDITERSRMTGTTDFTTADGARTTGTLTLDYNDLYERDSSLATAAGNYQNEFGDVISVNSNGEIFSQDPSTGCIVNGEASIIDNRFNAYRVEYDYSSCTGSNAFLNGRTFRGLATLDNTVSPEQLVAGVTSGSGSDLVAVVGVFERT